jgi:hypothetical protein
MSRADEIRRRLHQLGDRLGEAPLPNDANEMEFVRRHLTMLRERQDLLVDLDACLTDEERLRAELNRRLFRWGGAVVGAVTGGIVFAGGVLQLWEQLAK